MRRVYCLIVVLFNIFCFQVTAQINVTTNGNGGQLAQIISGNGVTITNVTMNCPSVASGTFHCINCDLGMDSGIVLTTGCASNVPGPNNSGFATCDNLTGGDQDLANVTGDNISDLYDACTLEFDLQVLSDSVQFKYVFGSEEYPEFACSSFNDVFAFFISGPGIAGQQNIALIPGTNIPVSINTVNGGPGAYSDGSCGTIYSQYYVHNGDGTNAPYDQSPYYIQYDGLTTVLTARRGGLLPCHTYHLKLAIADVGDPDYDSGVFIEANSLTSNVVAFDSVKTSIPNVRDAVRGCVDGIFTLQFPTPVTQNTYVDYKISGTAVNGTDYSTITDSVLFHTGDTTAQIIIHPLNTANNHDSETVVLYLYNICSTTPYDSSVMLIVDSAKMVVGPNASICPGDSVQLTAVGPSTFSWSPATGLSATNIANPIAFPSVTTTYKCTSTLGSCHVADSLTITIISPPFSVDAGPDKINCSGNGAYLNATVTGSMVNGQPFIYSWSPSTNLSNDTILNPVATPTVTSTYTIYVSSGHCTVHDSVNVSIGNIQSSVSSTNTTCYGSADGTATINLTGVPPYTYHWSNNDNTQNITDLAIGTYFVTGSDNIGCIVVDSVVIASPPKISFSTPVISNVSCYGKTDGSISITASGGSGTLHYVWSSGTSYTGTVNNLAANTPYKVIVSDSLSCTADTSISVTEPPQIIVTNTSTNVACFGGHDGSATVNVSGGVGNYTYLWNNDPLATTADTGLTKGTYTLIVSDSTNCTVGDTIIITQPPLLTAPDVAAGPRCTYTTDGTINISPTGGTLPYQFNLNLNDTAYITNSSTGTFSNLAAGHYSFTVTDAHNCTASAALTLSLPVPDIYELALTPTSCFGPQYNDGIVNVSPVNPVNGPFMYAIDGGATQSSNSFYNLSAGTHNVVITNENDCVTDTTITITQPLEGIADIYPSDTTIKLGESVQLFASFSPYSDSAINSYSWAPSNGLNCVDCFDPVVTSYAHVNEYTLTITYNNSCFAIAKARVIFKGNPPVYIPNAFTPNNDGNNDVFLIYGEGIKTVDMKIFNRWGEEVFNSNNQFYGWDGTYKGVLQNPGVYVYEADITYIDDTKSLRTGSVTLIR